MQGIVVGDFTRLVEIKQGLVEGHHALLSGLLHDAKGLVRSILKKMGVAYEDMAGHVDQSIKKLPKVEGGVGQIYLSRELDGVLEKSLQESQKLKDEYISVEEDGRPVNIISWTDTEILISGARCKGTVAVNALFGSATRDQ